MTIIGEFVIHRLVVQTKPKSTESMKTVLKILNAPEKTTDPMWVNLLANLAGLVAQVESVIRRFTIINRDDSEHRQWTAKFVVEPQPRFDCVLVRNPKENGENDGIFEGITITCSVFSVDQPAREIVGTLYPDFWPWGSIEDLESVTMAN